MSEAETEVKRPSREILLALAGVLYLAGMLLSARITITDTSSDRAEFEVVAVAYAMPGVVPAALAAALAVALTVLALITRRGRVLSPTVRFAIASGTGLLLGALAAVPFYSINVEGSIYASAAGTIAAAGTIGGALAGIRHQRVTAAAGWGAIAVFLIGIILAFLQEDLLPVFGAGDTSESQAAAASYWGYAQGLLGGLAAGLIAYFLLRRAHRRSGSDIRWPLYAATGAGPGVILVIAEILSRTLGARVLDLAAKVSTLDATVQQLLSTTRLNNGLMVFFVGAFTAMVAVGRTMKTPEDVEPDPAATTRGSRIPKAASIPAPAPTDPDEVEKAAREEV